MAKKGARQTDGKWIRKHYRRSEVKEIILQFCQDGSGWRALNGDQGWYHTNKNGSVRLRSPDDYDDTVAKHRTLYATLDFLDAAVKDVTEQWDEEAHKTKKPIGTFRECQAYTLGADIDGIGNIIEAPSIKQAVEDAAKFLVAKLNDAGVLKSVHCLYSGGGIYVFIHHALFQAKPEWSRDERKHAFWSVTKAYNLFLADVERDFFERHPEHQGKVKIDKINNQKRKFKCIFSIHKKHDIVVVPLDPANIKIDFERAKVPLSDDVLQEGREWYKDYSIDEKDKVKKLLAPKVDLVEEDVKQRNERTGNFEISKLSEPMPIDDWPPCMKNVIDKAEPGKGSHRACAVLASYLYQAGWSEGEALKVWKPVAERCSVEGRIFEQWYGKMSCPSCSTIEQTSDGYPNVGLGGLGYCEPDDSCNECKWPGGYNKLSIDELMRILKRDRDKLKDQRVLKRLADLKHNELEYALFLKEAGISGEIRKALEREIARIRKRSEKESVPPEIHAKAMEILEKGDPIQFITNSCGKMVLGAEKAFKKLICCVSVQNIRQSAGLHPKLNGESGGGKTWALLTFAHHLPAEAVLKGSMSAKAGYYHKDGDRLFRILDDYQAGNEDLDTMIKQTSSEFHERYTHRTVANNKALLLQIGSEQTWAITSVDSSQDIQVLNRQIPINVNDSEELTKEVNRRILQRYGSGETQFPVDENVLTCRELFRILREEGYINIKVPFSDRIEWLDTSNRRNTSIFMDLLIGITAMNRFQREKDENGYNLATEADFYSAKELFIERDAEELVHRLTKRERQFAELLMKHKEGLTREQVAMELSLTPSRISHLANGDKGKGGLTQKLPGFASQEITDYEEKPDGNKRAIRKTLFKLMDYNPLDGFDAIVKLRDSAHSADGVRFKAHTNARAKNDNSEREKREKDRENAENAGREKGAFSDHGRLSSREDRSNCDREISRSRKEGQFPHSDKITTSRGSKVERTPRRMFAHTPHSEANDSDALPTRQIQTIGPNPRRDMPTPRVKNAELKGDATCPICHEEIGPGHSRRTLEGTAYCTSCANHLSMIRTSCKTLSEKNGKAPTLNEIHEDISRRDRTP